MASRYYHMIQSFRPGEITPELALEIAKEFAREHLSGYEAVIGTHVDRGAHPLTYPVQFRQRGHRREVSQQRHKAIISRIRAISDRLCREHGLSVIVQGGACQGGQLHRVAAPVQGAAHLPHLCWRRICGRPSRTPTTWATSSCSWSIRGMRIRHGNRLGFRLRGQERFQYPGRRDPLFAEEGSVPPSRATWKQIEAGRRPAVPAPASVSDPTRSIPRYKGFLALYVHYLYLLGKIEQRQYPPRMTPHSAAGGHAALTSIRSSLHSCGKINIVDA